MWHIWQRGQVHADFWWGNMKNRNHLENAQWEDNIKTNVKYNWWVWSEL